MISRSSYRPLISALLLTFAASTAGCIGKNPDEHVSQDAQALIDDGAWENGGGYDGDFTGSDYPTSCTYGDQDFGDPSSVVQDDVVEPPMPVVIIVGHRLPKDPEIEALNLSPAASEIAYQIKDDNPGVTFTSGRRDLTGQAHAMAGNVIHNRQWIAQTYSASALRTALQQWVDSHPGATRAQIESGLLSVFEAAAPADVASFSKHLSGDAFDVQPVDGPAGNAIYNDLSNLPGRFIDNEGGLRRWHYER